MLRIADTFTDALGRLTRDEQKAVKTTVFDLQVNPAHPGLSFHKLSHARNRNFWSVRASSDIRIIVHRTGESVLACYVDHHDAAYAWAERRKLEVHPKTGAAQLVVIRETVVDVPAPSAPIPSGPASPPPSPPLLAHHTAEAILGFGVPAEWVDDVLAATEDSILDVARHLPAEAAEAVLTLATGGTPVTPTTQPAGADPFAHPDAQRRFRTVRDAEELERAFAAPWEKWTVFLHPAQRALIERHFGGPARVAGSAGTGKSVVALHRAVFLAKESKDSRVLVTTFSVTLARLLKQKLRHLIDAETDLGSRIIVDTVDEAARSLYEKSFGRPKLATEGMLRATLVEEAAKAGVARFSERFLLQEFLEVVDAWQLRSWEAYRDVPRLGRKTRLGEKQRALLWKVFSATLDRLEAGAMVTPATMMDAVTRDLTPDSVPYTHVVVDEAQDVSVPQLRFLAALAGNRPDGLFFAGDLGQRIFQTPFSWKALGVDVRGRSTTLRVNYRTSHQIRRMADQLLAPEISDVDGNAESRRGTVSVFDGPPPEIRRFETAGDEVAAVGAWISKRLSEGTLPEEIGVFVRSADKLDRATQAVTAAGVTPVAPAPGSDLEPGHVVLLPMHLAKGLEFKAVVVACCDEDELPHQGRIEALGDDADLDEVYESERHLLYVACTRARERLLVTAVEPGSEFLGDLTARR